MAILATAAALHAGNARAAEPVKLYPFEKATLSYAVSGAQTGTQTIYIKDYGRQTVQHYQASVPGNEGEQSIDVLTFTDPQWVYTYDNGTSEASRSPNPQAGMAPEAKNSQELFEKITTSLGGQKSGTDTFDGTPCTVWRMAEPAGTTLCVDDQQVMRYMRMNNEMMQGNVELESARIGVVDDSKFQRPQADYRDVDMGPQRD
ncbi:hypothetical protein [Iodidimonas sp. SYSU 1G8]|uniref:hypothetical protein n=1 Tax=Iodidimonas sp. SYSU 1G8 TaxID=3133967 RepID=UPI0031FEB010